MAKQGMKRMERTHTKQRNEISPVPEVQGKAKNGKKPANPIIAGDDEYKVYHTKPFSKEKPISSAYSVIDTDLARDNFENDLPEADLQNL